MEPYFLGSSLFYLIVKVENKNKLEVRGAVLSVGL
jgi:hypothetical protein